MAFFPITRKNLRSKMISLNKKDDFRRVFDTGKSAGGHFAVLYALYHGDGPNRYGFIVSKKALGKRAVDRNRAKRRLKAAVFNQTEKMKNGYDLIFICRRPLLEGNFLEIESGVQRLLRKLGVLDK